MHNYPFEQHIELFQALTKVFEAHGIDYYMIGGQARDLLLSQQNIRPISVTVDIDFAIKVYSMGQYHELKNELYAAGFEATKIPYRIRWKTTSTAVDLLPFGSITVDECIRFEEGSIILSVVGFEELLDAREHHFLDKAKTLSIAIAPLHGISLLKFISWDEKREVRQKDLDDLYQILTSYWDFYTDEAYDHHFDIFDPKVKYLEGYGARILGRHIAKSLSEAPYLKNRLIGILLSQSILVDPPGPMLLRFAKETWDGEKTIEYSQELLEQLLLGLEGK